MSTKKGKKVTFAEVTEMINYHIQGLEHGEVGELMGLHESTVRRHLKQNKILIDKAKNNLALDKVIIKNLTNILSANLKIVDDTLFMLEKTISNMRKEFEDDDESTLSISEINVVMRAFEKASKAALDIMNNADKSFNNQMSLMFKKEEIVVRLEQLQKDADFNEELMDSISMMIDNMEK